MSAHARACVILIALLLITPFAAHPDAVVLKAALSAEVAAAVNLLPNPSLEETAARCRWRTCSAGSDTPWN